MIDKTKQLVLLSLNNKLFISELQVQELRLYPRISSSPIQFSSIKESFNRIRIVFGVQI